MKQLLFSTLFVVLFTCGALAQNDTTKVNWGSTPLLTSKNILAEVGKKLAVCDTVVDYRVVNADLTLLNLGGKYPNQNITIAVKGSDIKVNPALMKGKLVCFYGNVTLFKNKPEMVITSPAQIKDIKQYQ